MCFGCQCIVLYYMSMWWRPQKLTRRCWTNVLLLQTKETNNDIGHLMTSLEGSIEEQRNIQKNCESIQARTKRLTGQQEKAMLMNLFFQFQNEDEEKGLSVEEFETFLDMLPCDSSEKLKGTLRDFKSVDKDNDNKISIKEFRNYVLVCANAIVGDESSTPGATASTLGKGLDYQACKLSVRASLLTDFTSKSLGVNNLDTQVAGHDATHRPT